MKKKQLFAGFALAILLAALLALPAAAQTGPAEHTAWAQRFQSGAVSTHSLREEDGLSLCSLTDEAGLYNTILAGLQSRAASINVSSFNILWTDEELDAMAGIYWQVCHDHPELFYVGTTVNYSGVQIGNQIIAFELTPEYFPDVSDETLAQFDAAVAAALSQVDESMSDLEKALVLHDYIAVNCAYNWKIATQGSSQDDDDRLFSAYGALVDGDAVCQGYALAYQLLLSRAGVTSRIVSGVNHMWNMVQLNGAWYHVDVTWDDPVPDMAGTASHSYFLVTDDQIRDSGSHSRWDADAPASTSTAYQSGYVFRDMESPLYWRDGAFYYVKGSALYRGGLTGAAVQVKNLYPLYSSDAVVWYKGTLIYSRYVSGGSFQMMQLDLGTLDARALGSVTAFSQAPSPDGYYAAGHDGVGLRLRRDETQGVVVESVSSTRRTVLNQVVLQDYPVAWDSVTTDTVAIAGISGTRAGIVWGGSAPAGRLNLVAAFYRGGRQVGVRLVPVAYERSGVQAVELGSLPAGYDEVRLMLLADVSWSPACDALGLAA